MGFLRSDAKGATASLQTGGFYRIVLLLKDLFSRGCSLLADEVIHRVVASKALSGGPLSREWWPVCP